MLGLLLLIPILSLAPARSRHNPDRPSASNRLEHPKGFSIIQPFGWTSNVGQEIKFGDKITETVESIGMRSSRSDVADTITVQQFKSIDDALRMHRDDDLRLGRFFQGSKSWQATKRYNGDNIKFFRFILIFKACGNGYAISYSRLNSDATPDMAPAYWEYFNTFQCKG